MTAVEIIAALRAGRTVWVNVPAGYVCGRRQFAPAPAADVDLDPTIDRTYYGLVARPGRPPIIGVIAKDRGRLWITNAVPVDGSGTIASIWVGRDALVGVHTEEYPR